MLNAECSIADYGFRIADCHFANPQSGIRNPQSKSGFHPEGSCTSQNLGTGFVQNLGLCNSLRDDSHFLFPRSRKKRERRIFELLRASKRVKKTSSSGWIENDVFTRGRSAGFFFENFFQKNFLEKRVKKNRANASFQRVIEKKSVGCGWFFEGRKNGGAGWFVAQDFMFFRKTSHFRQEKQGFLKKNGQSGRSFCGTKEGQVFRKFKPLLSKWCFLSGRPGVAAERTARLIFFAVGAANLGYARHGVFLAFDLQSLKSSWVGYLDSGSF